MNITTTFKKSGPFKKSGHNFMNHDEHKDNKDISEMEELVIESRFGEIAVNVKNSIYFPQGLLGLPDNLHFCLTDIPNKNMNKFRLLQCLNDVSLSFVVLPIEIDNSLIDRKDIDECCELAKINIDDLLILLVVSVQRTPSDVKVTANIRAPIIVDTHDRAALQYVFPNNKYQISQRLN